MNAIYTVRRTKIPNVFEVAKWDDEWSKRPSEIYKVTLPKEQSHKQPWCSCLGFRRMNGDKWEHKHVEVVTNFLELEEPSLGYFEYDNEGQLWWDAPYDQYFKSVERI